MPLSEGRHLDTLSTVLIKNYSFASLGGSAPLCKQSEMEYFLTHHVPCIWWSSKRRESRTGKHIFTLSQVQYREKQPEAEIHTDRLTGTQHSLGEPAALQACSWAFLTVTVLLAPLQNVWVSDHT